MKKFIILSVFVITTLGCERTNEEIKPTAIDIATLKIEVAKNYSNLVYANYEDCYNTALSLKSAIDAFVAAPSEAGLTTAQNAWKAARIPYSQTDAFRFYGGPIDDENGPEGRLNAWPLDEGYIDYTETNGAIVNGGIINNTTNFATLTKESISAANENEGESNISIGYHAIEFLLWGQDKYAGSPGKRPYTDYITNSTASTALNAARRGQYLQLCVDILIDDLAYLKEQWKDGGSYRNKITNSDSSSYYISKFFDGIGKLSKGELAGERMTVSVSSGDQEDEHSCFSDFTTTDIQNNFKGIKNVYLGSYTNISGTVTSGKSLADLVRSVNIAADDSVKVSLQRAELKMGLISNPYDQAILKESNIILNAAAELKKLSDKIADAGFKLGYTVNTNLD
ncbi:MAG: imelysin family protein [Cytophagales bacterium]